MAARLKTIYETELKKKIIVNSITREAVSNGKIVDLVVEEVATVTGQKPVIARAKKSIASFKLREGQAIGAFVTLRGERMYEFLDRMINFSLPRVKDFRGLSPKGFDGRGNYTMGLKEQIIFPEINYDRIDKVRGMGISFVTTAENNEEGRELLKLFGMPFREK
jgi:large subunit ribosomal protein L5